MNTVTRMSGATRYTRAFDEDEDNSDDDRAQEFAQLLRSRTRLPSHNSAPHDAFPNTMDERQRVLAEFAASLENAFFRSPAGKSAKFLKLRLTNGPFAGLLIEAEQEESSSRIMIRLFPDRLHSQCFLRIFGCGAKLAASLSKMFHRPITIEMRDPAPQVEFDANPSTQ